MPTNGTLPRVVISLDFELRWGTHDRSGTRLDVIGPRLDRVREAVPALLQIFSARSIRVTWAAVGALACSNWSEYFARAPLPPKYRDAALALDPRDAERDPDGRLHFAADLLHAVHRTPGQDLGTHTFAHILMREPGVTADDVTADLKAVSDLWQERFDAPPVSLVFPRNQVAFLALVRSCGIRMWRGNEPGWYYDRNERSTNRPAPRFRRLLDAVNPFVRHATAPEGDMTRASLFLRTNLPAGLWALHHTRIRNELDSLRPHQVFHLWWHPDNLGVDTRTRLARVEQVVDLVAERCVRGRVLSCNMRDLVL